MCSLRKLSTILLISLTTIGKHITAIFQNDNVMIHQAETMKKMIVLEETLQSALAIQDLKQKMYAPCNGHLKLRSVGDMTC